MPITIDCFKAYDIRGQIPNQLNDDIAYRIANAMAEFLDARTIVIGRDIRLSSAAFADAVAQGLTDAGVQVLDIGLCGTELVYFATAEQQADGGIMITASHNPMDYNGLKLVRQESRPISADTGLKEIRAIAEQDTRRTASSPGKRRNIDVSGDYDRHILSYVDQASLQPLSLVVNAGNGGAGAVIDRFEPHLPFRFTKVNHEPDGNFPNGVPNPLLLENRASTIAAIKASGADLGIAWDGDFDRCFLFDERGIFIEGYYIVGLLAQSLLQQEPGAAIVHDPRLTWNTQDIVQEYGGRCVQSKSGHSFMKERMREVDGVYGGEMSAHHYFRRFFYCDSGMIPWLLVAELISKSGRSLSELVGDRMQRYPASGEINRELSDSAAALALLHDRYAEAALSVDATDGYSFEFPEWRFNIRTSNTEPVVRLNVESRGDASLMQAKTDEILNLLETA